jgi:hypothetical protein
VSAGNGDIRTIGTLSGGAGSWGACRRWIDQQGRDGLLLLFTDVRGKDWANPNVGEDADTMRFLRDARDDLGVPLVVIRNHRTIWDVFRERKWLGNSSLAHCSWELKTGPAAHWASQNAPRVDRILVGIDFTEAHRLPGIVENWQPYQAVAPLMDKPMLWKPQLIDMLHERGIEPPRMYRLGFAHSNCPACVKGGHDHWARLWRVWPERYLYAEQQERDIRAEFGADVSILKDRKGGTAKPMTLEEFRHRLQAQEEAGQLSLLGDFTGFDEGGCACFTGTAVKPHLSLIRDSDWDGRYDWHISAPGELLEAA